MPLCSTVATGMGHLLLLSRGDRLGTAPLSGWEQGSCMPGTCCQQQVGHVQLMLLSLGGDPEQPQNPKQGDRPSQAQQQRDPSCSGELSR